MTRHKRTATKSAKVADAKPAPQARVPIVFLVPPSLAKAITDAAEFSGNLFCKDVVIADHVILAKPRGLKPEKVLHNDFKTEF